MMHAVTTRAPLWQPILLFAGCLVGGLALGLSLRGGYFAVLAPVFVAPMLLAVQRNQTRLEIAFASGLFGLSFYATAFQGLLGPWDGAFGGMWMLLTITYSIAHIVVCLISQPIVRRLGESVWWCYPFAIVWYEYWRHLITKLYDGCGLTFCLIGQSWTEQALLLQSADIGGVWLLSFMVAFCASTIAYAAQRGVNISKRLLMGFTFASSLGLMLLYGHLQTRTSRRDVVGRVVLVPQRMTSSSFTSSQELLDSYAEASSVVDRNGLWTCIVGPETCMHWNAAGTRSGFEAANEMLQHALIGLTRARHCYAVVGAWVQTAESQPVRNAAVILHDGSVRVIVDKQQPAPFVEGRPFGTTWLIDAGMIPVAATRTVASPQPADTRRWSAESIPFAPAVCYDLFFPATLRPYPRSTNTVVICCLDETFDGNGVFRQLSQVHTRLRAVEFRRAVVRCSLGGPSGCYDANGQKVRPLVERDGLMLFEIPGDSRQSLYAAYGDWFPNASFLLSLAFVSVKMLDKRQALSRTISAESEADV